MLAVSRTGAIPVFVDHDEFYLIDIDQIERKVTKKQKPLLRFIFMGKWQTCLKKIANNYKLHLIEDAAQAHGSAI